MLRAPWTCCFIFEVSPLADAVLSVRLEKDMEGRVHVMSFQMAKNRRRIAYFIA